MAGASADVVMAGDGGTEAGGAGNISLMASLTPDEVREIKEYDKLLRFRDQVISGAHPRIKPIHLLGKVVRSQDLPPTSAPATSTVPPPSQPATTKSAVNGERPVVDNFQSRQANLQKPPVNVASSLPGLGALPNSSGGAKSLGPGKPEFDSVLLEKSDDLVKAEIQLQRQRLERSLREQLEQRRMASKASEQLAELDVADILAKALSLVHATPAQSTDETAANNSATSDSFDDNTFYSSRHDTPEFNMVSRIPNESEDEEMREGSPYEPELDMEPVVQSEKALPTQTAPPSGAPSQQQQQQQNTSAPLEAPLPDAGVMVPGLTFAGAGRTQTYARPPAPEAAGALQSSSGTRSEEPGSTGSSSQPSHALDLARVNELSLNQALAREPSPLVRAHDLSPLAPQPTHALPPVIARQPHLAAPGSGGGRQAAPAQVAALRKQPSNASSPESSPHGNRAAEKKKNKKKKRKADRLAAETAAPSTYIKSEPRSPSPLTSDQYARPNKRQRHDQQPLEINDDEPRYERPIQAEKGYQQRYQPRVVRQERVVGYERGDGYQIRYGDEPVLVTSPRYERVYYDDYPPPPLSYPTGPEPASAHPVQYVSREVRPARPATRIVEGPYDDGAPYYREVRAASRMSVRPTAYRDPSQSPVVYERPPAAMPPPTAPPARIVVDAYGREYREPPARAATVIREEVVPEPRGPASEHRYERVLPPRALSRRPEPLDDDTVLYQPASPAYAAPRRVVTQPEYATSEHRAYRDGGTASNRMPPRPSEYVPSRTRLDGPIAAEPPREYIARASSVRPPPVEPARYDHSLGYERVAAVEDRPRGDYYGASSGVVRAASVRPAEGGAVRYEVPVAYERRVFGGADEQPVPVPVREYPAPPPPQLCGRSASVRPPAAAAEPVRYEVPGVGVNYGARVATTTTVREYAPPPPRPAYPGAAGGESSLQHHHHPPPPPPPPPAGRAYSVVPGEAPPPPQVVRREYAAPPQPAERYYGRPPGPPGPPPVREDEEVVYLDRPPPREVYREMR
ncbi:hypothetical protein VTK56DRAFT_6386 [Thermocarpiscus australiensis]